MHQGQACFKFDFQDKACKSKSLALERGRLLNSPRDFGNRSLKGKLHSGESGGERRIPQVSTQ